MNEEKTQELLLQLVKDVSYIRAKLDGVEEIRSDVDAVSVKVDELDRKLAESERTVKSLQHRCDMVEEWLRQDLQTNSNTGWKIIGAVALAVFSALLGFFL